MKYNASFKISNSDVSLCDSTYFIADIAANHDGSLNRALDLIWKAKEAGANCAKFQHFEAGKIVSSYGFSQLKKEDTSHQSRWEKSVVDVYDQYHTRREWNELLVKECNKANIEFMTTPYDIGAVESLLGEINAIKIGSGDITHIPFLESVAMMNKPILLATGASHMTDVIRAVEHINLFNRDICLMQCNTNYTGDTDNFNYVNLNVLKTFATLFPNMPLGFSDHTPGHSAVLGAITLGARIIEKHFTDDNSRVGPDHSFAMNPDTWNEMVLRSRELEAALGDGVKRVESNELQTVVVQRRAIRSKVDLLAGDIIKLEDLEFLRPCPSDALTPGDLSEVVGSKITRNISSGDHFTRDDFS